jgi:mono/diheme cytochrome c family protein
MNINYIHKIAAGLALTLVFSSCVKNENSFGYEYMPDMYRSPAPEAYVDYGEVRSWKTDTALTNRQSAKLPPMGTIPFQGADADPAYSLPYKRLPSKAMIVTHSAMSLEYNDGDYDASVADVSPMGMYESNVEHGKQLYTTFCDHCHGDKGAGDGVIAEKGLIVPPANAFTKADGQMFYSITYGKGDMGSHASQLNQKERWQIISYIKSMNGESVLPDVVEGLDNEIKETTVLVDSLIHNESVEVLHETEHESTEGSH